MTMWGEVNEGSVSHFVCGSTSARVQVMATPIAEADRVTETATLTSDGVQSRPFSSPGDDDESSTVARSSRAGTSLSTTDDRPRVNTAVIATTRASASARSTAAAVRTAQAIFGAAGGIAGIVAWVV